MPVPYKRLRLPTLHSYGDARKLDTDNHVAIADWEKQFYDIIAEIQSGDGVFGFVPYTGATADLDLGIYEIDASNLNIANWDTAYGWGDHSLEGYLTVADLAGYVPYTGATADVDLGSHSLWAGVTVEGGNFKTSDARTNNSDTILIGSNAGASLAASSSQGNVFIGRDCGYTEVGYSGNVYVGFQASKYTQGIGNISLGYNAGRSKTGDAGGGWVNYNVNIGYYAGYDSGTNSEDNIVIGREAGKSYTNAYGNIFLGYYSGRLTSSGDLNVSVGYNALTANTTGGNSVALGCYAGKYETAGSKLFIDARDRGSEANGRTQSLIYGVFDGTVANQSIAFNAGYVYLSNDNEKIVFGAGNDASVYYDGTNLIVNPKVVGTGYLSVLGGIASSNLTSGRIPIVSTGGLLVDTGNFTYSSIAINFQNDSSAMFGIRSANDTNGNYPYFRMDRARGTLASPTDVSAGYVVGAINWYGYKTDNYYGVASFSAWVDDVAGTYVKGFLNFGVSDGTTAGVNVDVFRAYYDRARFYKLIQSDLGGTVGVKESVRLTYKNAIDSGVQISARIDDVGTTETGRIEHILLTGALGAWIFYGYNGASLVENMRLTGDGLLYTTNKVVFTQTDGNEYIDSLADGYLDLVATSDVRINNNLDVIGIQKYENAFVFTLGASASTASVTFPTAFGAGVTPVIVCTPPYQTSFWITSITNTGFTFNVGTTSGYDQSINCIAMETT